MIKFKEFELDSDRYELRRNGRAVKLEKLPMELLILLVTNKGRLVTRLEIIECLWGNQVFIDSEHGINTAIRKLRQALRDDPGKPRFVETVTGKGYRFVVQAIELEEFPGVKSTPENVTAPNDAAPISDIREKDSDRTEPDVLAPPAQRRNGRRIVMLAAAGGVLFAGTGVATWQLRRPLPPPHISAYTQITHDGREKYLGGTDGSRLYFIWSSPPTVAQVGVTGGEVATIPVAVPGEMEGLRSVSPDGSGLLVSVGQEYTPAVFRALWNVPALGGSGRRLPDAIAAAFSPDGNTVAYSTQGEIRLVGSDGTGAHRLASIAGSVTDLSWAPDGSRIEFSSESPLREIASNGSNLHQMLPGWNISDWQSCGGWTFDSSFFLFLARGSTAAGGSPNSTAQRFYRGQIWALDERRGPFRQPPAEPIQLTTSPIQWGKPIPAKDGKKIFAVGMTPRGELTRYDAHTRQFQPFLKGISAEDVTFSRDGASVAYVSYPEGILWKANRDGSNPVQLSDSSIYAMNPRWSPDGSQIVFMDPGPWRHDSSYVVPADGGSPRRLAEGRQADPTWSPDGRKILFATGVFGDPNKEDLRILDLASGQITIVPGSSGMEGPRWSPDGRTIAALPFAGGMSVFDMETQRWKSLVKEGNVGGWEAFSADGRFLYYMNVGHDQGVFRVRVKGGKPERVIDLTNWHMTGLFGYWMALDPTDAPLLLRDTGTSDIYALTLEEK